MSQITDYQAILFDVDRTMTNYSQELSKATLSSLEALIQAGFVVGVCTGRSFPAIKDFILQHFPDEALHIVNGGGSIVNSKGRVMHEQPISDDFVKHAIEKLSPNYQTFLATHQKLYISENDLMNYQTHPWKIKATSMADYEGESVLLVSATNISDNELRQKMPVGQETVKEMTNNKGVIYVDVTAPGVNKSTALQIWSDLTQIPLEKTIGFGDSENDLEFLSSVGFSVAMGNADEKIKNLADRVIEHVDHEGLSNYIFKSLSGEEI